MHNPPLDQGAGSAAQHWLVSLQAEHNRNDASDADEECPLSCTVDDDMDVIGMDMEASQQGAAAELDKKVARCAPCHNF